MTDSRKLVRVGGLALGAAGLLCAGVPFIPSWGSTQEVGAATWQIAYHLVTFHHLLLPLGLVALLAAHGGRIAPSLAAGFALALLGNVLAAAIGVVRLSVLPVLAANPDTLGMLICTPFHVPATLAAEGFIATACADTRFDALEAWTAAADLTLLAGSAALGLAVARARVLPAWPGFVLAAGALYAASGLFVPLPLAIADLAFTAIGIAYAVWGAAIAAGPRAEIR